MKDILAGIALCVSAILIVGWIDAPPKENETEQQAKPQEQISDKHGSEDADTVLTDKSEIKIQMLSPLTGGE